MSPKRRTESRDTGKPCDIALFGGQADSLLPLIEQHGNLRVVEKKPDVVVCYGGDGTLLAAELQWPGIPKTPILNSRRGHRCIPRPPRTVLEALANHALIRNTYTKLECAISATRRRSAPDFLLTCLNEFNVHMGRINSAVRFTITINGTPFENDLEIISDGFVACTAFGSTAYFKSITKGYFTQGIGVAFKATTCPVTHLVLPENAEIRIQITRGPAVLAFDNSTDYLELERGDALTIRKHAQSAIILTCDPVTHLDEPF